MLDRCIEIFVLLSVKTHDCILSIVRVTAKFRMRHRHATMKKRFFPQHEKGKEKKDLRRYNIYDRNLVYDIYLTLPTKRRNGRRKNTEEKPANYESESLTMKLGEVVHCMATSTEVDS